MISNFLPYFEEKKAMADQEVIKHTKKLFNIWGNRNTKFWHKVKEFTLEIIIIVFAVSLSIWLHGRSEHAHQQHDVKTFLLGLREDLTNDIKEMHEDKKSFNSGKVIFSYLSSLKATEKTNPDTIAAHQRDFFNGTGLVANTGRFEGFKSAGKIGTIENLTLQNEILDLYVEAIPALKNSTDYYSQNKKRFVDLLTSQVKRTSDSTTNIAEVLATPEAYNNATMLRDIAEIINRYDTCILKSQQIIEQINKEYQ